MYRYDAVKDYVEFMFRRLNVEIQAGRGCCGVDHDALVIWLPNLDRYQFFLREDLPVSKKNEAVGVADGGKARKFDGDTRFCETAGEIAPSFGHDLPGLRLSTCYDSPGSGGFVFDRRRLFSLAAARS